MNKFDQKFFGSYISEWEKIIEIAHKHFIVIINTIILNYFFWVILPTFLYYNSELLQSIIPFFVLEIFIISIFIKNIYDIFDWYNDVWIITENWVIELSWRLFSSSSISVKYRNIEWLELIQTGFIDTILWKWDIVIHKIWWWDNFLLNSATKAFDTLQIIDKILKKHKKEEEEENDIEWFKEQNFETVLKALSGVVEDYLWKSWYKKDDSEERQELIKKVKKQWWAIDLSE